MTSSERRYIQECATCATAITPRQADWTVGAMPPRQWADQHNNIAAAEPNPHAHSPTPLCGCGHPAEQAIGAHPARCGAHDCTCTQHPALDWAPAPGRAPIDWFQIGRNARANGEHWAPALHEKVRDALTGVPVGDPTTLEIMQRYSEGWDAENLVRASGWCTRCGHRYENPTTPSCECAGDPPIGADGHRLPPSDPAERAYYARVLSLRFVPAE